MTVRPGSGWGERVPLPADAVTAASDAELARWVAEGDRWPIVLRGGDLHRTLGEPAPGDDVLRVPIDLLRVTTDGDEYVAAAHVVVRRPGPLGWWRGPVVAVMNAEHLGRWDVAPRAHPNDGRADVVEVSATMGWRARWQAWRRLPSGTHVPHPAVTMRRITHERFEWDEPLAVWVDDVLVGRSRRLEVAVIPDAATVYA
jgi:hypothetical protein